ncbi:MAG: hypothetical protein WCJ33_05775 [Pseudomonadota bacterium]
MSPITFDTLASVKRMKAKGIKAEEAEAIAEELRVASDVDTSTLATKMELSMFKSEMKEDFAKIDTKIAEAKSETIKYMFTGFLAVISLLVAILLKH